MVRFHPSPLMRRLKGSSVFLIFKGKLLLLLRDNDPNISSPNCWHLIGGISDKNEKPEETLVREVKEEINININIKNCKFLSVVHLRKGNESCFDKYLYYYKLTPKEVDQIQLGNEGQKLKFFSLKELGEITLSRITIPCIQQSKDLIKKILK